jgi:hypothetical protein
MFRPYHAGIVLCLLASACVRPAPTEPDSTPPGITLTLLSGSGTPHFSTDETDTNPFDACGTTRAFPATVSVAVGDAGGVEFVNIRMFPATLVPGSVTVGPASPETSVDVSRVGAADIVAITVRSPGSDLVRTGMLATFDVSESGAILVSAFDIAGNSIGLYQVDIRSPNDGVVCRNDPA